ncbi:hypothetical protein [Clostridium manihotivorum]|uniref:Uncharacterized protein n=1 Tax=Clostridium manihotivorum TaxID=2320868 RepID=A0A3R5UF96_9CLOT|nr:hypothetical protein [Clostridium manihotivorum]QAA32136.1 hypothetical protein C1I91_10990 [Clostridium manihotivorum]
MEITETFINNIKEKDQLSKEEIKKIFLLEKRAIELMNTKEKLSEEDTLIVEFLKSEEYYSLKRGFYESEIFKAKKHIKYFWYIAACLVVLDLFMVFYSLNFIALGALLLFGLIIVFTILKIFLLLLEYSYRNLGEN